MRHVGCVRVCVCKNFLILEVCVSEITFQSLRCVCVCVCQNESTFQSHGCVHARMLVRAGVCTRVRVCYLFFMGLFGEFRINANLKFPPMLYQTKNFV